MPKTTRAVALTCALAMAAAGLSTAAMGADAKSQIETRQKNFKTMGKAFKGINDELKKPKPNVAFIRTSATTMNQLAPHVGEWFPRGTGPETRIEMKAKPDVWTDQATFAAAARRLGPEVAKLQQISMSGDLNAIRAQTKATGGACKNCHDKFRVPEEH